MKLIFTKEILDPALKKLGHAVLGKPTLPVIENILVEVEKTQTRFITTDTNITVCHRFDQNAGGVEGTFLIPFNDLKKIVALEQGEIVIEADKKGNVTIKTETDKFQIGKPGDVADFPKIPQVASKNMFSINGSFIPSLIMAAITTAPKEDLRTQLTHIYINVRPGEITVVSTEGNQIYERVITADIGKSDEDELLVPPVISKVLDGFSETKIGFNKSNACFESGPVTIYARRGEGKYVAYKAVIPEYQQNMKLNLGEVETALQKVSIISKQDITDKVTFVISNSELTLMSRSEDMDKAAEARIICESTTEVGEIHFTGNKLANALKQLRGHASEGGDIEMSISKPTKAVLFKIAGQPELTVLLMPIVNI